MSAPRNDVDEAQGSGGASARYGAPGIVLSSRAAAELAGASLARRPLEACGPLVGRRRADGVEVVRAPEAPNLAAHAHSAFEVDPGAIVAHEHAARRDRLELVGFWHSHPRGGERPSPADAHMTWPGLVAVLVSLDGGRVAFSGWHRPVDGGPWARCACRTRESRDAPASRAASAKR